MTVPLRLFLQVCFGSVDHLLHDSEIVLASLFRTCAEPGSFFIDSTSGITSSREESGGECIKVYQTSRFLVESSSYSTVSSTFLIEEFDKVGF